MYICSIKQNDDISAFFFLTASVDLDDLINIFSPLLTVNLQYYIFFFIVIWQ